MRKIIVLFLTLLSFTCCENREDSRVDITVMPEATNEGAYTFGCLVDGWLYVGGRYVKKSGIFINRSSYLRFTYREEDQMDVFVKVKPEINIKFVIHSPEEGNECIYTDVWFANEKLENGKVYITRFDKRERIISGRFEGGRMTNGRFDVHYIIEK